MDDKNEKNEKNDKSNIESMPPPSLPVKKNSNNESMPPPSFPIQKKQHQQSPPPPQQPKIDLIYKEPEWSKVNNDMNLKFEVIKSGTIIEDIDLNNKPFYLVGRLPVCDIPLEHPTISRQHAVIQHKPGGYLFLYDLASTHGTMINKQRVKPNIHVPIKTGDVIKFGESTRLFVLDGPNDMKTEINQKEKEIQDELLRKKKQLEKEKQQKSFISLYSSISNSNDQDSSEDISKIIHENRDIDHDEEIRKHYSNSNNNNNNEDDFENDLDNSRNKLKKKNQDDDDDDEGNDDDEFYDRTNEMKNKLNSKLKNESTLELIEKRKTLEIERYLLQQQFKESTLIKTKQQQEEEEEDSLDQFMNENNQNLKKNVQQKIMASLIDIENQVKQIESILNSKLDFKKHSKSLELSIKSIKENGLDLSSNNSNISNNINNINTNTAVKETVTIATTSNLNILKPPPPDSVNNSSNNNINTSTTQKTINKIFSDDNDDDKSNNNRTVHKLDDDIPEQYKIKETNSKKRSTNNSNLQQSSIVDTKKLKQKQKTEIVDLISREENNDDAPVNRYGY